MKKFIYSLFVLAFAAMTFTSCEDVPAPYNMPQEVIDGEGDTATPTGTGTKEDPYNVAAANQAGEALAVGESTETVYIKGIVSRIDEIDAAEYGNATYYISDDGSVNGQFLVYRGYSLGGDRFTSEDELKLGDEVIVMGTITNYNGTIELNQRNQIYSLNGVTAGGGEIEGEGEGTEASPYDVTKALSLIANGENDPEAEVYIKGVVSQIDEISAQFGNATYYISTDGTTTTQLYVFRGYYLKGDKFPSTSALNVGDEVVILGKLTTFYDDPQVGTGSKLVSINGQTEIQPGTEALPYTPAQALEVINSGSYDPEAEVFVKGIISEIQEVSTKFGNATYYISEDGSTTTQLQVFRGYYLNGEKFTAEDQIKVGDEVVVKGTLNNYKGNSPQVNTGSQIVSLTPGSSETGVTVDGAIVTLTNGSVAAGTETATLNVTDITGMEKQDVVTSLTLSDGSVLTFSKAEGSSAPAYYNTTVRVYANNTIHFSCKKPIAKVVFTCENGSNTGSPTAMVTFSGNEATFTNKVDVNKGNQLRIESIVVTYAK